MLKFENVKKSCYQTYDDGLYAWFHCIYVWFECCGVNGLHFNSQVTAISMHNLNVFILMVPTLKSFLIL